MPDDTYIDTECLQELVRVLGAVAVLRLVGGWKQAGARLTVDAAVYTLDLLAANYQQL